MSVRYASHSALLADSSIDTESWLYSLLAEHLLAVLNLTGLDVVKASAAASINAAAAANDSPDTIL